MLRVVPRHGGLPTRCPLPRSGILLPCRRVPAWSATGSRPSKTYSHICLDRKTRRSARYIADTAMLAGNSCQDCLGGIRSRHLFRHGDSLRKSSLRRSGDAQYQSSPSRRIGSISWRLHSITALRPDCSTGQEALLSHWHSQSDSMPAVRTKMVHCGRSEPRRPGIAVSEVDRLERSGSVVKFFPSYLT